MQSIRFCPLRCQRFARFVGFVLALASAVHLRAAGETEKKLFDLPASTAEKSLKLFSEQSGRGVVFVSSVVKNVPTNPVKGEFTPSEALAQLTASTPLVVSVDEKSGAFAVRKETSAERKNDSRTARDSGRPTGTARTSEDGTIVLDTFEVMNSKLLNMDLTRTRDDAQPYVIFDRAKIEQSGATSIEDFLKKRLTMNTVGDTASQGFSPSGSKSSFNLRGLGTGQTLILVDGRRSTGVSYQGAPAQPDLNGIPLSAVERIDILPTTASGIYGGGATGGVINIVLRRNYSGGELKFTYDNSFSTDTAMRRLDFSVGTNFEGGRSNLMIAGSLSRQNVLTRNDRDFDVRGRSSFLADNGNDYASLEVFGFVPPLGSTANIVSADGTNLTLKSGAALNSTRTFVPVNYGGSSTDSGAALVANAGRYNLGLASDSSSPYGGGTAGLLNGPETQSLMITLRRQMTTNVDAFLDLGGANNVGFFPYSNYADDLFFGFSLPRSAPTNPFNQDIVVSVPAPTPAGDGYSIRSETRRASGGVIVKLPADWKAEGDFVWSRSVNTYRNAGGSAIGLADAATAGTIDVLRDYSPGQWRLLLAGYPAQPNVSTTKIPDSEMKDGALRVGGPIAALPAGKIAASALLERRQEFVGEGLLTSNTVQFTQLFPSKSQAVNSAYAELHVPLISPEQDVGGIQSLEVMAAARRDEYRIDGVTASVANPATNPPIARTTNQVKATSPTVALDLTTVNGFTFRASYGKGFLPPTVFQSVPRVLAPSATAGFADTKRGNTRVTLTSSHFQTGGNPILRPEKSESWSAGVILAPPALTGFRLSVDYTRITKTDNITTLTNQQVVDNEAFLPGRVVRGPKLASDPADWAGPVTFLDATSVNLAKAFVEAYDVQLDQRLELQGAGRLDLYAIATWQTHLTTQILPNQPEVEMVGIGSGNPLPFKANGGITWVLGNWKAGWNVTYFDSYLVADPAVASNAARIRNQGNGGRIPSQIYHDVSVTYSFPSNVGHWSPALRNTEIQVGVRNLLNRKPPIEATDDELSGYYSHFGDPRLSSYWISIKRAF